MSYSDFSGSVSNSFLNTKPNAAQVAYAKANEERDKYYNDTKQDSSLYQQQIAQAQQKNASSNWSAFKRGEEPGELYDKSLDYNRINKGGKSRKSRKMRKTRKSRKMRKTRKSRKLRKTRK